jgi:chromosomal replication initiation ATPase DnaA
VTSTDTLTLQREMDAIHSATGVTIWEVQGKSRLRTIVQARHALMRRLRQLGWSYPAIGAATGRHHSTVIYCLRVSPS